MRKSGNSLSKDQGSGTSFFTKDFNKSILRTENPSFLKKMETMQINLTKQDINKKFIKGLFVNKKSLTSYVKNKDQGEHQTERTLACDG